MDTVLSVKASENTDSYFVDATGNTTQIDDAGDINIISGKLSGGDSAVVPEEGSENVELVLDNGKHTVSDEKITVTGLDEGESVYATTDDQGKVNQISGMPEGSSVTIDGTTYTAPEDDSTLKHTDDDGWYFEGYELDEYTVNVNRRGNVSVDAGVKLTNVVESGKSADDGEVTLAVNTAQIPVTVNNESTGNSKFLSDENGTLIEKLSKGANIMRIPDDLKFSDVWVTGQIPPTDEDDIDAWVKRIHSELQHKVMRDGMGLPHLRVDDNLEPLGDLTDGGVKLVGKVTIYARVPRADWIYVCDDMTNLFDEVFGFNVQVDVDHDYFIDE